MKTKIILSIALLVIMVGVFAQNSSVTLTFTAERNGQHVVMSSILLENLTMGSDTTLYEPDTLLVLNYVSENGEIITNREYAFTIFQNYPNPVQDKSTVIIYMPENNKVLITVRNVFGSELLRWENNINKGYHSLTFFPGWEENIYFLTGRVNRHSQTIKMINSPAKAYVKGISRLEYNGEITGPGVVSNISNNFALKLGDQLKFTATTAMGNRTIMDIPYGNQNYSFQYGVPCTSNPTVTYEGKVYHTVLIGSQCWLEENLNVGTMISGSQNQTNNGIIEKYCYNNDPANCDIYGGLYQWDEMMDFTTTQGGQGICPPGWHIPTDEEWMVLEGSADSQYGVGDPEWSNTGWRGFDSGKNLKSESGWISGGNGTNLSGYRALPGGSRYADGLFYFIGHHGRWSTSTEGSAGNAWRRSLDYDSEISYRTSFEKTYGRSVRCLMDNGI